MSVILPSDTVIERKKITQYLLVPQVRGDKSGFLARAGYTPENADMLLRDLREQLLPLDAVLTTADGFGQYYENRGDLKGPNGTAVHVRAIWMTERLTGVTKFITLIPDKRKGK
jgi:hypothetical protein